jgi:hypothetical protein
MRCLIPIQTIAADFVWPVDIDKWTLSNSTAMATKPIKRPRDSVKLAKPISDVATGQAAEPIRTQRTRTTPRMRRHLKTRRTRWTRNIRTWRAPRALRQRWGPFNHWVACKTERLYGASPHVAARGSGFGRPLISDRNCAVDSAPTRHGLPTVHQYAQLHDRHAVHAFGLLDRQSDH